MFLKIKNFRNLFPIKIGNYNLKSYFTFPNYYNRFPYYDRNIQLLGKLVAKKYSDKVFIDVGASIGDTIALWRTDGVKNYIHAFESNKKYYKLLYKNIDNNVTIRNKFVNGFDENAIENVCLLKTDTDGNDMNILSNSLIFLQKDKPVIFTELNKFEDELILRVLLRIGYIYAVIYSNYGLMLFVTDLWSSEFKQAIKFMQRGGVEYFDIALFIEKDFDILLSLINEYDKDN